jgi:hypothetical protein
VRPRPTLRRSLPAAAAALPGLSVVAAAATAALAVGRALLRRAAFTAAAVAAGLRPRLRPEPAPCAAPCEAAGRAVGSADNSLLSQALQSVTCQPSSASWYFSSVSAAGTSTACTAFTVPGPRCCTTWGSISRAPRRLMCWAVVISWRPFSRCSCMNRCTTCGCSTSDISFWSCAPRWKPAAAAVRLIVDQ